MMCFRERPLSVSALENRPRQEGRRWGEVLVMQTLGRKGRRRRWGRW